MKNNFTYKLKEKHIQRPSDNYFVDYLTALGISKTDSFTEAPTFEDYENPFRLKGLEEALSILKEGFENNKTFFVQIDSDVDGITSSAIFYRYFKDLYPEAKILYRVHEGKEHGVIYDTIPIEADIIVIPDSGSNQFDEQERLSASGRKVVVLDHHEVDDILKLDGVVVVNNQSSPLFKNKYLSGAGIVYKTIHAYSKMFHDGKSHEKYIDLAALGIISDMMSSKELDNNYIIYHGLRNIQNPMIKGLLKQQAFSVSSTEVPTKIDIAFYVTPIINGVVRVGTVEQNTELFEAFIDYNNTETFAKSYRGNVSYETYYEKIARESANIRARQNKIKTEGMEFLDGMVQEQKLHENVVIAVITSKDDDLTLDKTLTGLVAMDFVKKYKKPTLVLRPRTEDGVKCYYGSARCNPVPGFVSLKDIVMESGLVKFAAGHGNAFGIGIEADKLEAFTQYMNEKYGHIDFGGEEVEVDYIFEEDEDLDFMMLNSFAKYSHVYGNGIPEPKFAFKVLVNKNTMSVIGQKGNTLKFNKNGVSFIQFRADLDMINEILYGTVENDPNSFVMQTDAVYMLEVIGRSQHNTFRDQKTLQVIVDNIKYHKVG